ncbi:MAG: molybdopterin dehydrogenase [Planctomycetes bacterium]|nr:molybdopterin dehydrogenase [Planctomycetota bacterium]
MKNFTYYRPTTTEQAVSLLEGRWGNTELLAGGTDLLALQKNYIAQPGRVVSLTGIAGLQTIVVGQQNVQIGAGVTLARIADHPDLRRLFPALTSAAGDIGGPQIRNMGTLGGNLCQRNRCWYFRDEHSPCLLRGGNRCSAIEGENKYHAIFTANHRCVIASPSTLATGLIALGATAEVLGPQNRRRTIQLANFFNAPTGPNDREHNLAPNEIVTGVTIPVRGLNNAAYEVRQKQSSDWPIVQVAVAFAGGRNGEKATGVKIVLSHVAPTPIIADGANRAVENRAITDAIAVAAGQAAVAGAKPLSQNGYKVRLVEVAVKRALTIAAGLPRYWEV